MDPLENTASIAHPAAKRVKQRNMGNFLSEVTKPKRDGNGDSREMSRGRRTEVVLVRGGGFVEDRADSVKTTAIFADCSTSPALNFTG